MGLEERQARPDRQDRRHQQARPQSQGHRRPAAAPETPRAGPGILRRPAPALHHRITRKRGRSRVEIRRYRNPRPSNARLKFFHSRIGRCKPLPNPDCVLGDVAAARLDRLGEIGERIARLQFKRIPKVRIWRRGFRSEAALEVARQLSGNKQPAGCLYGRSVRRERSRRSIWPDCDGSLATGLVDCIVASLFELWARQKAPSARRSLARTSRRRSSMVTYQCGALGHSIAVHDKAFSRIRW